MTEPLLSVRDLSKHYTSRGTRLTILQGISFDIGKGEVVGLVGESGSGKTTIGRSVLRLVEPSAGSVRFDGTELTGLSSSEMRRARPRMQYIFQDPFASLSPRMTIGEILMEGLKIQGIGTSKERLERARKALEQVDLPGDAVNRYAHEFSGGQRQRIGIARALTLAPEFIVADEPVSALDVSIRSQILNLLRELQNRLGLAYIFVSHDLAVVKHIADHVAVMNLGQIVETAEADALFAAPSHPYSRALLSAIPVPKPQAKRSRIVLQGEIPSALNPRPGCRFHTRCPYVVERCRSEMPQLATDGIGHATACHRTSELPSSAAIVPSDGGFSPVLEKLVAAFSGGPEAVRGSGV